MKHTSFRSLRRNILNKIVETQPGPKKKRIKINPNNNYAAAAAAATKAAVIADCRVRGSKQASFERDLQKFARARALETCLPR